MPASTLRGIGLVLRGLVAATFLLALVVGLPWALWHYIGWPLPRHVPTWAEIETVLLGPMTTTFLLNILACLCWLVWAAFVINVARCAAQAARDGVHTARWPRVSARRPVHALAAVLVSAIMLSVLGNRVTSPPTSALSTLAGRGTPVAATAPAWRAAPMPSPVMSTVAVQHPVHASQQTRSATPAENTRPHTAVVRAPDPETGVYDSLSRIAERMLGTRARWPDIFQLNEGKPQPNGRTFTNPHLIFPGEVLQLPPDATIPPRPQKTPHHPPQTPPAPSTPSTPPPATPPPPTTTPPTTTPPTTTPPTTTPPTTTTSPTSSSPSAAPSTPPTAGDSTPPTSREPAITWGSELFVGLGLAAAVAAALAIARRRHRRGYQPGSGRRDDLDLPVAPVVYQLQLAHLRAERDDEVDLDVDDFTSGTSPGMDSGAGRYGRRPPPSPAMIIGSADPDARSAGVLALGLGVRDGREVALDLAVARGLGLIGAGAPAAARALLATAMTTTINVTTTNVTTTSIKPMNTATHRGTNSVPGPVDDLARPVGASMLVPADDLPLLLGHGMNRAHLPRSMRLVASLEKALDELEADILQRAREQDASPWPPVVLIARPSEHDRRRLQAVLDNGALYGIVGILFGQWQPGVTAYVRQDGTVSATDPGVGETLRGTQVFRLGANDATDLLTLLHYAQPATPSVDAVLGSEVPRPLTGRTTPPRDNAITDVITHDAEPGDDGDGGGAVGGSIDDSVGDQGVVAGHAVLAADTELEVTAVTGPVEQTSDADLEIIDARTETRAVPPPDVRIRPPAMVGRQPIPTAAEARYADVRGDETARDGWTRGTDTVGPGDTSRKPEAESAAVPVRLTVLGQPRVYWYPHTDDERDVTGVFQPRLRELLVFLGLHPEGATRESLTAALWTNSAPEKTTNALNTALSRLRAALSKATDGTLTDITVVGEGNYRLDAALVDVDYWHFDRAVAHRRAAKTPQDRIDAHHDIVNTYTGPLADGMSTEWIESAREGIRRDALDAVAALARALVDDDPEQTLDLLEIARAFDPHNELIYRDLMRLQERLDRLDAIPRTLTLLTTRLAEVDDQPTPQTINLANRLQQRHETNQPDPTGSPRRGERGRHGSDRSAAS
jgi:DNA-binding SARP family transcriptional activator